MESHADFVDMDELVGTESVDAASTQQQRSIAIHRAIEVTGHLRKFDALTHSIMRVHKTTVRLFRCKLSTEGTNLDDRDDHDDHGHETHGHKCMDYAPGDEDDLDDLDDLDDFDRCNLDDANHEELKGAASRCYKTLKNAYTSVRALHDHIERHRPSGSIGEGKNTHASHRLRGMLCDLMYASRLRGAVNIDKKLRTLHAGYHSLFHMAVQRDVDGVAETRCTPEVRMSTAQLEETARTGDTAIKKAMDSGSNLTKLAKFEGTISRWLHKQSHVWDKEHLKAQRAKIEYYMFKASHDNHDGGETVDEIHTALRHIADAVADATNRFKNRDIDILRSNGDLKEMVLGAAPSAYNVIEPEDLMQSISRELSIFKSDIMQILRSLDESDDPVYVPVQAIPAAEAAEAAEAEAEEEAAFFSDHHLMAVRPSASSLRPLKRPRCSGSFAEEQKQIGVKVTTRRNCELFWVGMLAPVDVAERVLSFSMDSGQSPPESVWQAVADVIEQNWSIVQTHSSDPEWLRRLLLEIYDTRSMLFDFVPMGHTSGEFLRRIPAQSYMGRLANVSDCIGQFNCFVRRNTAMTTVAVSEWLGGMVSQLTRFIGEFPAPGTRADEIKGCIDSFNDGWGHVPVCDDSEFIDAIADVDGDGDNVTEMIRAFFAENDTADPSIVARMERDFRFLHVVSEYGEKEQDEYDEAVDKHMSIEEMRDGATTNVAFSEDTATTTRASYAAVQNAPAGMRDESAIEQRRVDYEKASIAVDDARQALGDANEKVVASQAVLTVTDQSTAAARAARDAIQAAIVYRKQTHQDNKRRVADALAASKQTPDKNEQTHPWCMHDILMWDTGEPPEYTYTDHHETNSVPFLIGKLLAVESTVLAIQEEPDVALDVSARHKIVCVLKSILASNTHDPSPMAALKRRFLRNSTAHVDYAQIFEFSVDKVTSMLELFATPRRLIRRIETTDAFSVALLHLERWCDRQLEVTDAMLPDRVMNILDQSQMLPIEKTELTDVIGPVFDATDMIKTKLEHCYGVTLGQQVLSDLLQKFPVLQTPDMSMDLMVNEKINDFYAPFMQLCGLHMQLTRRYNGIRLTYAKDGAVMANNYRTLCFVFRHAKVVVISSGTGKQTAYLLDTRQNDIANATTRADAHIRQLMRFHSCQILTTGAVVAESRRVRNELQQQKHEQQAEKDKAIVEINNDVEKLEIVLAAATVAANDASDAKTIAEVDRAKRELRKLQDNKWLSIKYDSVYGVARLARNLTITTASAAAKVWVSQATYWPTTATMIFKALEHITARL